MIRKKRHSGFSILEILIAVVIIGILAVILVPALSNRAEKARFAVAAAELQAIGDAQERIGIELGYYVRLYALNDLPGGNNQPIDGLPPFDGIADEFLNTSFYNTPRVLFINQNTHDFLSATRSDDIYTQLASGAMSWNGPYYNIHRDETPAQHSISNNPAVLSHLSGIPNDPWGNDYMFFLRPGRVLEPDGNIEDRGDILGPNGVINVNFESLYDRPTILSLGPNRVYDSGAGDDISFSFGF